MWATADLAGGIAVTYAGSLTGSGTGTAQLSGILDVGLGGLTLNFPGSMLQWAGGRIDTTTGDVTNLGTINISGSDLLANDGTLDNFGSIIQAGSGSLTLHSDGSRPTTLKNEPGASYVFQADSGINGDTGAIVNAGKILIEKFERRFSWNVVWLVRELGDRRGHAGRKSHDTRLNVKVQHVEGSDFHRTRVGSLRLRG